MKSALLRKQSWRPRVIGIGLLLVASATLVPSSSRVAADSPDTATTPEPTPTAQNFDPALEELIDTQGQLLGDRWGGAWWHADGTVTVAVTDDNPLPSPLATNPKVRIETVRFSAARLDATMETVTARLNPLLAADLEPGTGAWPYIARVKLDQNVLEVEVDEEHTGKRPLVETALADELATGTVRIVYGDVAPATPACASRTSCTPPFRGGTETNSASSCTLGFVMKNPTGQRFQSTASHCVSSGNWYHAGRSIGPTHWTNDTGDRDFLVIRQNNQAEPAPTNWVYRNANKATAVTTKLTTLSGGLGAPVCFLGKVSDESCGTVTSTNASWGGRGGFGEMKGPVTAPAPICKGDSGAPVINPTNNRAYGTVNGWTGIDTSCTSGFPIVFTWLTKAEAASGTTLLDKSTSQTLGAGQRMPCGYALLSTTGNYNLQMQCSDGNLVVRTSAGAPVWDSGTWPNPGAFLVMQYDGNLVIYRSDGVLLWNRPWSGWVSKSYLELQNDGNLVVYTESRSVRWHRLCNCTSMP